MKFKDNWLFFIVIIILILLDIFMVVKFWSSDSVDAGDIIALVGLSLAIFTLVINTFLSLKYSEDSKYMEISRMQQSYESNAASLKQQLDIAKLDKNANVLTKYRMNWLQNIKQNTMNFEEEFWKFLLIPTKTYEENAEIIGVSYSALTNYISFLKSELNITKEIDSEIIKNYEKMNVYMSQINGLNIKTDNSYLEKCTKASMHDLIPKEKLQIVKEYLEKLNKYSITEEEKSIYPPEMIEEMEARLSSVFQQYLFELPSRVEIDNKLLEYFHSKIELLFNEFSIKMRIYFKTEWERIKLEIMSLDSSLEDFNFKETFNKYLKMNTMFDQDKSKK